LARIPAGALGIRAKLILVTILLIGLISLFIYLFFPARGEHQAQAALFAKGRSIAAMTAYNVAPALYFDDPETLEEALASARQNPDVVSVAVRDTAGVLVLGQGLASPTDPLEGTVDPESIRIDEPVAFRGVRLGSLAVILSLVEVRAETSRNRRAVAVVSLLIFTLGMGAIIAVSGVITRPLNRIVATAERVASGDLSERAPVTSRDEVGLLAVVFNRMVDSLQEARDRLEEANRTLELRVSERTGDLQRQIEERLRVEKARAQLEDQLRQAQKMEAIGQLTAGVAHNFNNMLQIILTSLELARLTAPSEVAEPLRDAFGATMRAADMVKELLLFGRRTSASKAPMSVEAVVREVAAMCQATFDRRITIEVVQSGALPPVLANEGQLRQAFLNLCINARDALGEARDSPRLELELATTAGTEFPGGPLASPAASYVRVRVQDNGTGMDAATLQHLYEPFFTTKEVGRGTGLGLATVYAILQDHGGGIACDSTPGEGTTFRVYLPAVVDDISRGAEAAPRTETTAAAGTILVVDDEEPIRRLVQAVLVPRGYRVLAAADGPEALALYQAQSGAISAVLLDLSMPGMSGAEVLSGLLRLDPKVRVLIATGYGVEAAELAGARGILHKPFAAVEVAEAVARVLEAE
jgi:signal transduction histidine kinase/CheY-like chemotaxis protein